jgi:hypothetical protein
MAKISKKKPAKKTVESKLNTLEKISVFLQRTRLHEYMDLVQKPGKMAWLNFWAGVWRGLGMMVGTVVVFALVGWIVKTMLQHAGGLPWIGSMIEEMVAWLLSIIEEKKA